MDFDHYSKEHILFITLKGDLLGETSGMSLAELANDFIGKEIIKCAVDLSQVRYMNSTGIGILIVLLTKFRNRNGELVLINPSEQIKKLLIITKLSSIFSIVPDEKEAIEKLN